MLRATLVLGLAALLLASPAAQAAWTVDLVGYDGSPVGDIAVGDGDRDGKREVYAATWDGIEQFRRTGSGWARTHVGGTGSSSVAVGDGDRDGKAEVYAGEPKAQLAKYVKVSGVWKRTVIADFVDYADIRTLTIGDVEGDGLRELYAGVGGDGQGREFNVHKLWFKDGAWHKTVIARLPARAITSWIADADRDGEAELLVGAANGGVYWVDRTGGKWRAGNIGFAGTADQWILGVAAGDGDGDGKAEVYAGGDNASVYRFAWTGSSWSRARIATFSAGVTDLALGDADNDGNTEVYVTSWNGHLYKLERGTTWTKQDLGTGDEESLFTLAIGDADGAAGREVYAGSFQGAQHPFGAVYRFRG